MAPARHPEPARLAIYQQTLAEGPNGPVFCRGSDHLYLCDFWAFTEMLSGTAFWSGSITAPGDA
jgi:hypothetical protein